MRCVSMIGFLILLCLGTAIAAEPLPAPQVYPVASSGTEAVLLIAMPTFERLRPLSASQTTLRLTLDGSEPTSTSLRFTNPVILTTPTTVKMRAFAPGRDPSPVVIRTYDIRLSRVAAMPVATPAAGAVAGPTDITLTTPTRGGVILYTTDGTLPTLCSRAYSRPVRITPPATLVAQTYALGWWPSRHLIASYTSGVTPPVLPATPTLLPGTTTATSPFTANLTTATAGAVIRVTTDGSEPTTTSPVVSGPLSIDRSQTVKAAAFNTAGQSPVVTATYTLRVADLVATPAAGTFDRTATVNVATLSPGVTIRWTQDGSEPTAVSPAWTAPLTLSATATLSWRAYREGWTASPILTGTWTIRQPTPTPVLPASATFTTDTPITVTAVPGAEMRFTADGTIPTVTSPVLTNPYLVTRSQTLIVVATAPGSLPSEPARAVYTCVVADPLATPVAGVFLGTVTVHAASTTPAASLRFTVDGTAPTDSSPVWAADLPLTTSTALSWRAFRAGWTASGVTTGTWSIQTPMPTVDVPSGTYNMDMAVLATPAQSGTTLRFTTDGTVPDAQAATITGALTINRSQTVTVVAQRDGCLPSEPVVRQYLMQVSTPTVDVPAGRYHQPIAVTVADATSTAQVAMTTNGSVPGADAPNITAPISLDQPTRLSLVGRRPGWTDSLPVVLDYAFQVAAPTIEPPAGTHVGSLQVTGSTATPGATLRWVAGTEPPGPTADPLPVSLDQTTTLTIQGVRTGWEPSTPMTATWTVVPTISFVTVATTMSEAALPQDIALRLSGPAPRDITLTVTILDGTAVADVDIRLLSPTVTIAAGASTAVLRVEPINRHRLSGSVGCQIGISVTDGAQFIGVPHAVTIQAEGVPLPPPVFTQRRSPMWKQPVEPFDYARWTNDAVYRTAYLAAVVPERVWECATESSHAGNLTIRSQQWGSDDEGEWCDLSLQGPASCPVTIVIMGSKAILPNLASTMTVATDGVGGVSIRLRIQIDAACQLMVGSPFISEAQRWMLVMGAQP